MDAKDPEDEQREETLKLYCVLNTGSLTDREGLVH
jgi:hypothetical protein